MGAKNRTSNDLFIGEEYLNVEGPAIKHPAYINYYANINVNKTREDPINLVGLDIETNNKTGELKLLGIYHMKTFNENYEGLYKPYYTNIFENLLAWIKRACDKNWNFAHWNRLDPFYLLKAFLLEQETEESVYDAMYRFGKISGEFNKETGEWDTKPVVSFSNGWIEFGIKNGIRNSVQFYYRYVGDDEIKTCWAFDIASFYNNGLESEADAHSSDFGRFDWYSKLGEEFHIIDWDRFDSDEEYKKNVLYSNEMDSRAGMALGYEVQKDFNVPFKAYPRSLVSTGSLARSAIIAVNTNRLKAQGYDENTLPDQLYDDISSIGIKRFLDEWTDKYGEEIVKNLYSCATEAYAGGKIDAIAYGKTPKGFYADLASAYPGIIKDLLDLRGSELITGKGEPPTPENGYIFIRGTVHIPEDADYHAITVRHPVYNSSNVSPVGDFKASYIWDEREDAKEIGATFEDEEWFYIKTPGKRSVLGQTTLDLVQLRNDLKSAGSTSEYMAKLVVNSMYGIQFEAVDTFTEGIDKPLRAGYRAGEFWNPINASIITGRVRVQMAKASRKIKENGGQPIVLMTDSITWKGKSTDLPEVIDLPWGKQTGIQKKKTLGWFEPPEKVKDIVCLGSGRYGFKQFNKKKNKWEIISKKRGLNIATIDREDENGHVVDMEFNWHEVLEKMREEGSTEVDVKVRTLISPAMVAIRKEYSVMDLGRIIDDSRNIQAIVGKTKRIFNDEMEDPEILNKQLVITDPVVLKRGMFGEWDFPDTTLKYIRDKMMTLKLKTRKQKRQKNNRKRWKRFYKVHKESLNEDAQNKYDWAKEESYNFRWCKKLSRWSWERIGKFETLVDNGFSLKESERLSKRGKERLDKHMKLMENGFENEIAEEMSKKDWDKINKVIERQT